MSTESTKTIKGRISNKHGTEADWYAAGTRSRFIPLPGELIIYDPDDIYGVRTKIGDGSTPVHLLPWASGCDETACLSIEKKGDGYYWVGGFGPDFGDAIYIKELIIPRGFCGEEVKGIADHAFLGYDQIKKVFIPDTIIEGMRSPFDNSKTEVYCEAESMPSGWYPYNNYNFIWGATKDIFSFNKKIGDTTALETESKEIVGAINELNAEVNSMLGTWVLNKELKVSNLSLETGYAELPVSGTYYCSGKDNLNFTFLFFQGKTDEIYEFGVGNTEVQQLLYFGHGEWDIVAGDRKMDILERSSPDVATWIRANAKKQSIDYQLYYSQGLKYTLSGDETYYICEGIGTCTDTELIIPPTYKGLPVKEIRYFNDCNSVASVIIPDSVSAIQDQAFMGCNNITQIIIPKSVISGLYEICNSTSQHITFYCGAESQPDDWYPGWIRSNFTVVWGFANDFVAVNDKLADIETGLNELRSIVQAIIGGTI